MREKWGKKTMGNDVLTSSLLKLQFNHLKLVRAIIRFLYETRILTEITNTIIFNIKIHC